MACKTGNGRIVVLEAKSERLQDPDADYKRRVLNVLPESFEGDQAVPARQLQIAMTGQTVARALILMNDTAARLPKLLAVGAS